MRFRRWHVWTSAAIVVGLTVWIASPIRAELPPALESLARLKTGNSQFIASPESALPIDAARRSELLIKITFGLKHGLDEAIHGGAFSGTSGS
jgi:hypothetical protein